MGRPQRALPVNIVRELSKAVDTDWFAANITAVGSGITDAGIPVRHTLQVMVNTSTAIQLLIDDGVNTDKTWKLNAGAALTANALYAFDFLVYPGVSYNVQHSTTTQAVNCQIFESKDLTIA